MPLGTPLCLLVYTWSGLGVSCCSSVVWCCDQGVPVVLGARWCFAPRPVSLHWCVVGQQCGALMLCSGARVTSCDAASLGCAGDGAGVWGAP